MTLCFSIVTYIFLFLRCAFIRYDCFNSQGFDLAIFNQSVWLISRGQTPFVTIRGLHILADHFSAVLYLLAPLYWLWPSPKVLLAAQTVALALGALPVYALTRRRTNSALVAVQFAIAYLLYPTVQWSSLCEFHPDTLATPLLLGALYCVEAKKWRGYFILLGLTALTKETVGLAIFAMGLYLFWHERRMGWFTIIFSVAALLVAQGTLYYFNHGQSSPYIWLYHNYGSTVGTISENLMFHPFATAATLNTQQNGDYLFQLLQPVAFLALLAPEVLALALPAVLANLLSSRIWMHNIYGWYTPLITPFIFMAAITGFVRCQQWKLLVVTRATMAFLGFSIVLGLGNGPLLLRPWPITHGITPAQSVEAHRLLSLIPANASIAAPTVLLPHLSHRAGVYVFPNPFYSVSWGATVQALQQQDGENYAPRTLEQYRQAANTAPVTYVILCPLPINPVPLNIYQAQVVALLRSPSYGLVAVGRGTLVLQRGADHVSGLQLLMHRTDLQQVTDADIQEVYEHWFDTAMAECETSSARPL